MKNAFVLSVLFLSTVVSAQLVPAFLNPAALLPSRRPHQSPGNPPHHQQDHMMDAPPIAIPPSDDKVNPPPSSDPSGLIINDVLPKTRSINIFAGFTRDIESISDRLDDKNSNTTLLCPLNSAVQALPRKPWEDPRDGGNARAYDGPEGEDRASRNLRRFVEAHVIGKSPWRKGEKTETLGGGTVWWEETDGVKKIQPGDIEVESVASAVSNGQIWILKGVVNYA